MITLHCLDTEDSFSAEIERRLEDLVVAYKVKRYSETDTSGLKIPLPFIDENGTIIRGEEEIKNYINQLSLELQQQRSITGDGCYIDPTTGDPC